MTLPIETALDRLAKLADCLCSTVREEGRPGFCFCGLVPGEAMADFYAGATESGGGCLDDPTDETDGYAWVRMTLGYIAEAVGVGKQAVDNCDGPLGVDAEVGILRCFPIEPDGSTASMKETLDLTAGQYLDMEAMRKAVTCCFGKGEVILGQYTPYGPMGGQYGGVWTLSLSVDF